MDTYRDFYDLVSFCIIPSLGDAFNYLYIVFIFTSIFRFILKLKLKIYSKQICSVILGLITLYVNLELKMVFLIAFVIITYLMLFLLKGRYYSGLLMLLACLSYLIIMELLDNAVWFQMRGIQMVITMKTISLAFDIKNEKVITPNLLEYIDYTIGVGNCVLSFWVPFSEYKQIFNENLPMNLAWFYYVIESIFQGVFWLIISNCCSKWFLDNLNFTWIIVYQHAVSFRASHYFMAKMTTSLLYLSGYGYNRKKHKWNLDIVKIREIEFPRSLVHIVIYWNMPVHHWLKSYVFRPCKLHGSFIAIIMTYTASAALHGFNAPLATILLSLGFFTYIEFHLRKQVSIAFSCCVEANKCSDKCKHLHKSNSMLTICLNLFFSFIAIIELAYLGIITDYLSDPEIKNPFTDTISIWNELNFLGHIIAFVGYLILFLTR